MHSSKACLLIAVVDPGRPRLGIVVLLGRADRPMPFQTVPRTVWNEPDNRNKTANTPNHLRYPKKQYVDQCSSATFSVWMVVTFEDFNSVKNEAKNDSIFFYLNQTVVCDFVLKEYRIGQY